MIGLIDNTALSFPVESQRTIGNGLDIDNILYFTMIGIIHFTLVSKGNNIQYGLWLCSLWWV